MKDSEWAALIEECRSSGIKLWFKIMVLFTAAIAIGLKNLIANSNNGHSTTIYSIIETAKANRLNPYMYLVHLLTQLPNLKELTPDTLKPFLPWEETLPQ